jgi:uncharacterized membrane protein YfcA
VSPADVAVGVAVGVVSGTLAGLIGVGGGIVMTPGIQVLLGAPPIVALATPLPVIFPTALAGALSYRRRGELDSRAAALLVGPGLVGAVAGAWMTELIDTTVLLIVTAGLLGYQAVRLLLAARRDAPHPIPRVTSTLTLGAIGFAAGSVSGLLGIGGGLVMVPLLAGRLGMPLKQALGTSLLAIVALVVPGTVVHAALGHIDVGIFLVLTAGAVPGARLGAAVALRARERTLRLVVGTGLLAIAIGYAVDRVVALLGN